MFNGEILTGPAFAHGVLENCVLIWITNTYLCGNFECLQNAFTARLFWHVWGVSKFPCPSIGWFDRQFWYEKFRFYQVKFPYVISPLKLKSFFYMFEGVLDGAIVALGGLSGWFANFITKTIYAKKFDMQWNRYIFCIICFKI